MDTNTKKIVIVVIGGVVALALLTLAGMLLYKESKYGSLNFPRDGVKLKYPKAWKLVDHPSPGVIAVFVSEKEDSLDSIQENISLTKTDLSSNPLTLDQYVALTNDQMTTIFADITIVESVPVKLSGHLGHKFVYKAPKHDSTLYLVVYAVLNKNTAYNITYLGLGERYPKDMLILQDVVDSFKTFF